MIAKYATVIYLAMTLFALGQGGFTDGGGDAGIGTNNEFVANAVTNVSVQAGTNFTATLPTSHDVTIGFPTQISFFANDSGYGGISNTNGLAPLTYVDAQDVAYSNALSGEIDSDIITHTGNASAHHTRYTDTEATNAATVAGFVKASITNTLAPISYVDAQDTLALLTNGTRAMGATLNMSGNVITNLPDGLVIKSATGFAKIVSTNRAGGIIIGYADDSDPGAAYMQINGPLSTNPDPNIILLSVRPSVNGTDIMLEGDISTNGLAPKTYVDAQDTSVSNSAITYTVNSTGALNSVAHTGELDPTALLTNGTRAMGANLPMGGKRITNIEGYQGSGTQVTGDDAMGFGDVGASGTITNSGAGAFAHGKASAGLSTATISATGNGSEAGGVVSSFDNGGSVLQATGQGSVAKGDVDGGSTYPGTLEATGQGSIALGAVYATSADTVLRASGRGAVAIGYAQNGTHRATGDGSFVLGENAQALANNAGVIGRGVTNPVADSLRIGWGTPTVTITQGIFDVTGTIRTNGAALAFAVDTDTGVTNLVLGAGLTGNITGRNLALTNTITDTDTGTTNLILGAGLSGNITGRNLVLTNTVTDTDNGVTNLVLGTGLSGNITGRNLAITNTVTDTDTGVTNLILGAGLAGNITGRSLAITNTVTDTDTDTTFTNRVNAGGLLTLEGGIQSGSNTIELTVATLEAQGFATNSITNTVGNWTGTFDSREGTGYLDRAIHTGTQAASTVSDFDAEVGNHPDVASNTTHRGITSGNPHSVTKSDVGLGSVENTALSTWPGTGSIAILGTITSGTWQATAVGESYIASTITRDTELAGATNDFANSENHRGLFDGQEGSYYLNAANLTGTLATARLNITNTHSATKGLFSDNGTNLYWKTDTSGGGQVESVNGQTGVVTVAAYPAADSNKLAGIQAGATSNSTDAFLLNWANITNHPNVSELGGTIASNEIDWASMPSGLQDGDNVGITVETDPGFAAVSNRVAYTNVANTFAGTQTFFSVAASGTVDGRDVSVDGTKLDGVAAGATSNSTASIQVIATNAVAQASPAINFANRPQINGTNILIPGEVAENPATANLNMAGYKITNIDQAIATDIRSSYQLNLAGVTNVNWDNQTFLTNGGLVWTFGAGSTVAVAVVTATGTMDGRDVSVDGTKLDGIAAGATSNSTDAVLLARANHTGTQTASTVSDFNAAATNAVSAASPGMNFANRMVVGATNTTTNVLFEVAGTAKVSAIYIGTDLVSGINTNTGLVVTNTGDFAQFTGLNGANGQVWRANGSGGGSWTNYSRGGVHTITAATNTVTFSPVFSVAPVSVVGSIGSQFDQVASVKILSIATNQFQYAVHGADGLITNAWDIYWIAHP